MIAKVHLGTVSLVCQVRHGRRRSRSISEVKTVSFQSDLASGAVVELEQVQFFLEHSIRKLLM